MRLADTRPKRILIALLLVLVGLWGPVSLATAENAVVRAILFYSTSCGHCQKVISEDLPPLIEKYGDQLQILAINVGVPEGQKLYQTAIQTFNISEDRLGVPCLIVDNTVLVGSLEIPEIFPQIIDQGLASGGIDWPDMPGLAEIIPPEMQVEGTIEQSTLTIGQRFARDPGGNTLATIVLLGMVTALVGGGYYRRTQHKPFSLSFPQWTIPVLAMLGMIIAGYLSFIEITQSEAVCGPIGDCNTVQQSEYAYLFGFVPIGVLGLAGYLAMLVGWALYHWGTKKYRRKAIYLLWVLALAGLLFSIYLTFLEPFVIGATCAWCIGSAITMALLFLAITGEVDK